jgi:hypothetical protein
VNNIDEIYFLTVKENMDEVCEVRELGFSTITQTGETFRVLSRAWASSHCCTRGGGDLPPSLAILDRYHGRKPKRKSSAFLLTA